jgi:formyl-CoA transferase
MRNDPRFSLRHKRVDNREALQARIESHFATGTTAHWQEVLLAHKVPCGPINTIAEALADPHVEARGLLAEVDGRRFTRAPINLSKTPVELRRGPGAIGQHSAEVLAGAGYSAGEIAALAKSGVIVVPDDG